MVRGEGFRERLTMMCSQEQQLQTTHGTNLDDMDTSTFVTDQFLTNVRTLIGHAIDAVHNGQLCDSLPFSTLDPLRARCRNDADLSLQRSVCLHHHRYQRADLHRHGRKGVDMEIGT